MSDTLRFGVGARVEVWISPDWKPGRHIEIISAHPPRCPPDGIWFPATVAAVHFQQQGWCPSFFCPYLVNDCAVFGYVSVSIMQLPRLH